MSCWRPDLGDYWSVHKSAEVKLLIIFGQNDYMLKRDPNITDVLWWVLGLCRESLGWAFHSLLTNPARVNRGRDIKKLQRWLCRATNTRDKPIKQPQRGQNGWIGKTHNLYVEHTSLVESDKEGTRRNQQIAPINGRKIWKRKNTMGRNDEFSRFILKTKVTCDKALLPGSPTHDHFQFLCSWLL